MLAQRTLWFVHLLPPPSTGCVNRKESQHLVCRRKTCLFKMIHFILQKLPVRLADNKLSCMSLEIQSRVPVKQVSIYKRLICLWSIGSFHQSWSHPLYKYCCPLSKTQLVMLWCLSNHHCVLIKERVLRDLEAQHKVGMKITIYEMRQILSFFVILLKHYLQYKAITGATYNTTI